MQKVNRHDAKALGLTKCYGSACIKHPELEGLRWVAGSCIACAKENLKKNRKENPSRTAAQKKKDYEKQKLNENFVQKRALRDKKYREINKEKIQAKQKIWRDANPDKVKATTKRTKTKNKATVLASNITRRIAKMHRTPIWITAIDKERIANEYKLAALLTKIEGVQWTVDHIIPLQGKLVSGLHVPSNLQVMRGSENSAKKNKYRVEV